MTETIANMLSEIAAVPSGQYPTKWGWFTTGWLTIEPDDEGIEINWMTGRDSHHRGGGKYQSIVIDPKGELVSYFTQAITVWMTYHRAHFNRRDPEDYNEAIEFARYCHDQLKRAGAPCG